MLDVIDSNQSAEQNGWRWLCALCYLLDNNSMSSKELQKKLPVGHPLKSARTHTNLLEPLATQLKKDLGNLTKISEIDFSGVEFENDINFSNFIFPVKTDFSNTTFLKDALFSDAIFLDTALFKNTKFNGERAKFKSTIFKKMADFSNATFKHYANLANSKFGGRTSFQKATFERHAPRLYRAELNKEIIWNRINWPKPPRGLWTLLYAGGRKLGYDWAESDNPENIRENQNAYEDLADHMKKLDKYHDQHLFYRHEMYCRRRLESHSTRHFYYFYEVFANYGYGLGEASLYWFLNMLFGFIALLIISCQGYPAIPNPFWCSFFTSIANAHSFLFFHDGALENCYLAFKNRPYFGFVWATQTILGIPFIFLLLLTLRIRFKLNDQNFK